MTPPLHRRRKGPGGCKSAHGGPPVTGLQGLKAATMPQVDLGAGVQLMMEASGPEGSEPATPNAGAVGGALQQQQVPQMMQFPRRL
jgi:hypothetical protein